MSKTFDTKRAAQDWAVRQEHEITQKPDKGNFPGKFSEILDRYARDVSPRKKGARWEIFRIEAIQRDILSRIKNADLSSRDIAAWRDRRLQEVSGSSVSREMQILSHACNIAVKEWHLLKENPVSAVARPRKNPPRDRLIAQEEIEKLCFVAGFEEGRDPQTKQQRVIVAFLFAIETAMRAGEILSLTPDRVDLDNRVARLINTKNSLNRDVPLSRRALALLRLLPQPASASELWFGLKSPQLDALFRKLTGKAGIDDLHFHDTRHEAITRLSKKLDVLALARAVGHRNLNQLQTYYNETAAELAQRLD